DRGPAVRSVVAFAPGGKLLAITLRAARVLPGGGLPGAGGPTHPAAAATQRINTEEPLEQLNQTLAVGHPGVARAALGTGELHSPNLASIINRIAPRVEVSFHSHRKSLPQAVADGAAPRNAK